MTHLTNDELVDALGDELAADRRSHLAACDPCRRQLAELRAVLDDAREVAVPEPSPVYWQMLSNRVRAAIAAEPVPAGGWRDWLRWPVLAPIGALALIVAALAVAVPRPFASPATVALSDSAIDAPLSDEHWTLVTSMVGEMDWDTAMSAGLAVAPGAAERAVAGLSEGEQQELTRLLQAELMRSKS